MAKCSPDPRVGGNFMFARQALAYLELACRTASADPSGWYLANFSRRLADCDKRYFTTFPGAGSAAERRKVPPAGCCAATAGRSASRGAIRHGSSRPSASLPANPGATNRWEDLDDLVHRGAIQRVHARGAVLRTPRRAPLLTVSPNRHLYLVVRPEVLLADLRFSAPACGDLLTAPRTGIPKATTVLASLPRTNAKATRPLSRTSSPQLNWSPRSMPAATSSAPVAVLDAGVKSARMP
jgi:hypothetical protein